MPPGTNAEEEHRQTFQAIAQGAKTLFEPGIVADGCHVRLDVLHKEGNAWALFEVKTSKGSSPDDYVDEIAFEVLTARTSGLDIRRCALLCLDPEYVLDGEVEPARLFREIDLTDAVKGALTRVADLRDAYKPIPDGRMPAIEPGKHCENCPFTSHCFTAVPEDSVLYLPGGTTRKIIEFRKNGTKTIPELDRNTLTPRQTLTFDAFVKGGTLVAPSLGSALDAMKFPASFVDFEVVAEPIPRVAGSKPYQALPFQWSCHVLRDSNSEPQHMEWLDGRGGDCREEFVASLLDAIEGTNGFVHYSPYELTQLRGLADQGIPKAKQALSLAQAGSFDLQKLVRESVAHPRFKGKTSIKTVLPVLCPGMTYEGLAIASGDVAQAAYVRMVAGGEADLRPALLEYCKLDTLAMVELYRALLRLAGR